MSKGKEVAAEWKKLLPPGFRFMPSDEVLCEYYLFRKVNGESIMPGIILETDVYQVNPFQLPGIDTEEQYTYFFTKRERKYPNGNKSARGTKDCKGYWKMTSKNNKVPKNCSKEEELLGKKNTLVYYLKSPDQRDVKTNWIMHEFELADRLLASTSQHPQKKQFNDMVVCRIYHRGKGESTDDEEQKDNSRNCLVEPKQADYTNNREPLLPPPPQQQHRQQQQQQQQQQQLRPKLQSPSKRKFEANESSITSHPHVANKLNFYGTHEHKQVNHINNQEPLPSQPPQQHQQQQQQLLRPKLPSPPPKQRFETNETITSHPHIAKKLKLYAGHDQQHNGVGQENPNTYHIPLEMVQHIHSTSTEEENTRGILHVKTEENSSNDHPQFDMSHNIIRDECIPLVSENFWVTPTEEWEEAVSNMPFEELNYYMDFYNRLV